MEIALVNNQTLKLKGKNVSFIIDPTSSIQKTPADAAVFLSGEADADNSSSKITDSRVIIKGPGSYEVGGARISGLKENGDFAYLFNIDGLSVFTAKASSIEKLKENETCDVLVINADKDAAESAASSFEARILVFYGEKGESSAKLLGKDFQELSKFSTTPDKLSQETQLILLK